MKDSLIGKTLGKCVLEEEIGKGGMGIVYKAHHLTLDVKVAVKVLKEDLCHKKDLLKRFEQEAKSAGKLKSPYVVRIFDIGQDEDEHYIVMELVKGETLHNILKVKKSLNIIKSVKIISNIAEGLSAAHDIGILHRDVKPANILINEDGIAKLVDFGIARLASHRTSLTEAGQIVGTLSYISPEQLNGEVSTKSDLYSLGVTFFEIITGQPPFTGTNPYQLINSHLSSEIPSVLDINPEIPVKVDIIIKKLLSKNPEDRFEDAESIVRELQEFLPVTKRRKTASLRMIKKDTKEDTKQSLEEIYKNTSEQTQEKNSEKVLNAKENLKKLKSRKKLWKVLIFISLTLVFILLPLVSWLTIIEYKNINNNLITFPEDGKVFEKNKVNIYGAMKSKYRPDIVINGKKVKTIPDPKKNKIWFFKKEILLKKGRNPIQINVIYNNTRLKKEVFWHYK